MRGRLFDASAFMMLTKRSPEDAPKLLRGEYLLDLTVYELGNAIWKINKLFKNGDREAAIEAIEQVHHLTSQMTRYDARDRRVLASIMGDAFQHNLTFYDSVYLTIASKLNLTLVTEDKKLAQAAKEADIPVNSTETLITSK